MFELLVEGGGALDDAPGGSPAHPVQIAAAIERIKAVASLKNGRFEVVLIWKPGDDSKNILIPH
jgi:hypothetical protein